MDRASSEPAAVRWWLVLPLSGACIGVDAFWILRAERVGYGPFFTTISIFANVLFLLTLLIGVNALLRRMLPRWALRRSEMLAFHALVALGAAVAGQDFAGALVPMLAHPFSFSTPANRWLEQFGTYLPAPLTVRDPVALSGFNQGSASLYRPENYGPWVVPGLLWSGFIAVLIATTICLNVLVRGMWQDRERLPFPVAELPLRMTEPTGELWRNRLFGVGFVAVSLVETLNGLHSLYPSLPEINLQHVDVSTGGIFLTRPWNAMGFTCTSFYPFAIGLGYLLPLDLSFSCWFFYLFWKAQMVLSRLLSWDTVPDFPFVREQSFGAYVAILAFVLFNGRHGWNQIRRKVLGQSSEVDDSEEGLSFRTASLGFAVGFALLTGFFVWAGLGIGFAVAAFALYFALALSVSRIRAELGPPVHDLHFSGPDHFLTRSLGTPAFSERDLTILNYFYWFNRAYRAHPMPVALEGLKSMRDIGSGQRGLVLALGATGGFAAVVAIWAYLHFAYDYGASARMRGGQGFSLEAFNRLAGWISQPQAPNATANLAAGGGFSFAALLLVARARLPWWPFHPIGYAISGSWSMNLVWMPLLIAWIIKAVLLRYGGVRLYRGAMPLFLGVILGQCVTGSAWHLVGMALGVHPYSFWGG